MPGRRFIAALQGKDNPILLPHEFIQEAIVASILACFPPAAFESSGPFKPILERSLPVAKPSIPQASVIVPLASPSSTDLISFLELRHRTPPRHG